jgi:hypothetical protein
VPAPCGEEDVDSAMQSKSLAEAFASWVVRTAGLTF